MYSLKFPSFSSSFACTSLVCCMQCAFMAQTAYSDPKRNLVPCDPTAWSVPPLQQWCPVTIWPPGGYLLPRGTPCAPPRTPEPPQPLGAPRSLQMASGAPDYCNFL